MTTMERARDLIDDARVIETIVKQLAVPRYFGTTREWRAGDVAIEHATRLGLPHASEPFEASDFFMVHVNKLPYFLFGVAMTCASVALMTAFSPVLALVLACSLATVAVSLEVIIKALKYPAMYSRFARVKTSRNVIVPPFEKAGPDQLHLVLVAHLDSKSEAPDPHVHFTTQYLSVFFGTLVFCTHVIAFAITDALTGTHLHPTWIFCYGIALGTVDMLRLGTAYFEGDSPGANDDASGVAIALLVQHKLRAARLRRVKVTCLLSGAEEIGEAGTWQFLHRHREELDRDKTAFVIIDGLATPTIFYFTSRGFQFKPFSPVVKDAVERLLAANHEATRGLTFTKLWMPPPANTDHSAVIKHDHDAFVFATPEMVSHTARDTPGRVDHVAMARFTRFLEALVKDIDMHEETRVKI